MSEAKLIEVSLSQSAGGKVQIVKYDLASDYHVSESHKYSIPEDWDEDQVNAFLDEKREALREHVDGLAQREYDERFAASYLSR